MPTGSRTKDHPLVWCVKHQMPAEANKSDLARAMGVRPQSLYKWLAACQQDRHFSIPAERAAQAARFFKVSPNLFRPDIWPLQA
jgi:transposase-like protein